MFQIDNYQGSFKLQAPPVSVCSRASHHYDEEMWQLRAQVLIKHCSQSGTVGKSASPTLKSVVSHELLRHCTSQDWKCALVFSKTAAAEAAR